MKKSLPITPFQITLIFSALWAFLVGAGLGVVYYASLPITRVDRAPIVAKNEPLKRYFIHGSDVGGSQWRAKISRMMQAEVTPRMVALTEGDLNLFIKQSIDRASEKNDKVKVVPNVDISQDSIGLSLVFYLSGRESPIVLQTRGEVVEEGGQFVYRATDGYLGALPLPTWLAQSIADSMLQRVFGAPEAVGIKDVWASLSQAEVVGSILRLSW